MNKKAENKEKNFLKFLVGFIGGTLLIEMLCSWNMMLGSLIAGLIIGITYMEMERR